MLFYYHFCINSSLIFLRQLHLLGHCFQSASPPRLSSLPYVSAVILNAIVICFIYLHTSSPYRQVHSVGANCGHVVDFLLDQTRSDTGSCDARRHIATHTRHTKYPITTIAAAGVVRQGHRCVDVIVFGICILIVNGIRCGE